MTQKPRTRFRRILREKSRIFRYRKDVIQVATSNKGKQAEYRRFFGERVRFLEIDLAEPSADPLTIVRFKACQHPGVLVDDVSLDVEGEDVGAEIRWQLQRLPEWRGRPAQFVCRIGLLQEHEVLVFEGSVAGTIVPPRGQSFGFNPYFQPKGASQTLAEDLKDMWNARFLAVQAYLENRPSYRLPPLFEWDGPFQSH